MRAKTTGLLLLICLHASLVQAARLVAPTYSGAVPESVQAERDSQPAAYLSKDGLEQVLAFYTRDSGKEPRTREVGGEYVSHYFEYMDARQVHAYDPVGSGIGVTVSRRVPPDCGGAPIGVCGAVEPYFAKLWLLKERGPLSREEYDRLVGKYAHLSAHYFPLGRGKDGGFRPMDKIIHQRCEDAPAKEVGDPEAIAREVQQLFAQGRYQEGNALMQRLGQQSAAITQASMGPEGVAHWKGCLEELERQAYPTRIVISTHPSEWAD